MSSSLVLYAALALALTGAAMLFRRRTRRQGAAIAGASAAVIIAVLLWPTSLEGTAVEQSRLDAIMPRWQFNERHEIHVDAPPERVYGAVRAVTADDIQFFRTLTFIRRFGRPLPPGILNASRDEPLLDVATRTSFRWLADEPPREVVVGTRIGRDTNATMNFLIAPDGRGGSNVSTETRIYSATAPAARAFAVYWRVIHPGSDIIRRSWLRAVKDRAERFSAARATETSK